MPGITLGLSVLPIFLSLLLFSIASTSTNVAHHEVILAERQAITELYEQRREIYEQQGITDIEPLAPMPELHLVDYGTISFAPVAALFSILISLLALNVPTVILLIIYAVCRRNRRRLPALDMMSLQDL